MHRHRLEQSMPINERLAQLVAHPLDVREVTSSTPVPCSMKETSFVYQDKRGFFLHFGRKTGKKSEIGLRSGRLAAPKPDFLLSAAETARKRWCTFCVSLLCKERTKVFRGRDLNRTEREIS